MSKSSAQRNRHYVFIEVHDKSLHIRYLDYARCEWKIKFTSAARAIGQSTRRIHGYCSCMSARSVLPHKPRYACPKQISPGEDDTQEKQTVVLRAAQRQ